MVSRAEPLLTTSTPPVHSYWTESNVEGKEGGHGMICAHMSQRTTVMEQSSLRVTAHAHSTSGDSQAGQAGVQSESS